MIISSILNCLIAKVQLLFLHAYKQIMIVLFSFDMFVTVFILNRLCVVY